MKQIEKGRLIADEIDTGSGMINVAIELGEETGFRVGDEVSIIPTVSGSADPLPLRLKVGAGSLDVSLEDLELAVRERAQTLRTFSHVIPETSSHFIVQALAEQMLGALKGRRNG